MTQSRVLVVGDVIDDILATISMPLRHNTDTPASIVKSSGGSAANTAVWLASSGIEVDFVGRVGASDVERFSKEFQKAGVTPHLVADKSRPTGTIVIVVEAESRTMLTDRGANTELDFAAIERELVEGASWVHLAGYSMFHHSHPETIAEFISRARSHGAQVCVDASSSGFIHDFGVERFLEATREVSLLRCNEDEAAILAGTDSLGIAVEFLGSHFSRAVITQGSQGVWLTEDGDAQMIPVAQPLESVDPTGAGDSFNAGLLAGLVKGESLPDAIARGNSLAAQCITKPGARP